MFKLSYFPDIWLFDVDGTLTPAGGVIDARFEEWLYTFALHHDVRVVTGGDHVRIERQLGSRLFKALTKAYCCLGSSTWGKGKQLSVSMFEPSPTLLSFSRGLATQSKFGPAEGGVLQLKPGGFSLVPAGLSAESSTLSRYEYWDTFEGERARIAEQIEQKFPAIKAQVSGRSSIDCFKRGLDKSQILSKLQGPVYFVADSMHEGGNDYTLAQGLLQRDPLNRVIPTCHWKQTWSWLVQHAPSTPFPGDYSLAIGIESEMAYY